MFSFEEYCEMFDALPAGPSFKEQEETIKSNNTAGECSGNQFLLCAAVNDIQEDEAYFEAIINQSDIETLNRLLPYFSEGTRIEKLILDRLRLMQCYSKGSRKQSNDPDFMRKNAFFPYLCSWIDRKGFKSDSDFYNQAGISRQAFSKMRNNQAPVSREMALHMAVALCLNYDESVEFLKHAGYSFNPNSRREQIISFLMRKGSYNFYEIEEILSVLHEKTFLSWD